MPDKPDQNQQTSPPYFHTDTQAALDAGAAVAGVERLDPESNKVPVHVVPKGYFVNITPLSTLEEYDGKPRRKTGNWMFGDVGSFIRYFNEHKNPDSRIFAEVTDIGAEFRGVLNMHGAQPSFNDHACSHELVPTHEWQVWRNNNKIGRTQGEFAVFLEENAGMFVDPSGADLLELVQTLEGHSNAEIRSAIKLANGQIQFRGVSQTKMDTVEVPAILTVSIAPFEGTAHVEMKARLRYRVDKGKITFSYDAVEPWLVVRAVVADVIQQITRMAGVEPFNGNAGNKNW